MFAIPPSSIAPNAIMSNVSKLVLIQLWLSHLRQGKRFQISFISELNTSLPWERQSFWETAPKQEVFCESKSAKALKTLHRHHGSLSTTQSIKRKASGKTKTTLQITKMEQGSCKARQASGPIQVLCNNKLANILTKCRGVNNGNFDTMHCIKYRVQAVDTEERKPHLWKTFLKTWHWCELFW